MKTLSVFALLLLCVLYACKKQEADGGHDFVQIPTGFPAITYPSDNGYTYERWSLGKQLFYDPILSGSNQVSCASCHQAEKAFSDTVAFSRGDMGVLGKSNAPSLGNIAYHPYFTRAGGVLTLEMQVLVPIQEHDEFNSNILEIAEELSRDSNYARHSRRAYGRNPDPYVITRAIANFERSLISGNSAFDRYFYRGDAKAITAAELRGYQLFNSPKTNCSACHGGFNFTDYSFQNNGLYEQYADSGRMRLTQLESDRALFKVPSLRNVELSKPYMHNGSIQTLEAVVEHYNSGGKNHKHKSPFIKPLMLTEQEKQDIVAFLKTLTDHTFVNNQRFKP